METFLIVYHLAASKQRETLGGLGGAAGPHRCIIKRRTMAEVLNWLADTFAPDVVGLEIHPIECEFPPVETP